MDKIISMAFCDDEALILETISSKVTKILTQCGVEVSYDKYTSSVDLLKAIQEGKRYDVAFLDIDMPKLSGLGLAKEIRQLDIEMDIIFISNREDRVFESFKVQPFSFIRKSNFTNDLKDALRAYINSRIISSSHIVLKPNNSSSVRKVNISEIVYIESYRNQQTVYLVSGEEIVVRMTMHELEEKLREYDILRIYKGYLVNLKYVQRIEKTGVLVNYKDGLVIGVSRERLQELKLIYLEYLRKTGTLFLQ